jgi:predicted nuclease of predicted toxin-antitoxin system
MRSLLEEMLSRQFVGLFDPGMEAVAVRQQGWSEKTKGESREAAEREFDALVTMDRGISHQ